MKTKTFKVSDFYDDEFVDFASYSTIRMIGSAIDGMKNVHRKIFTTVLDKNIKSEIKVAQLNSKVAEHCLAGDTIINTEMGSITIEELSKEYADKEFLVPCFDDNNEITTGVGHHPRETKEVTELLEFELEDGSIFKCTHDHKFKVLRDGTYIWVEANDICEGDDILHTA